MTETYTHQQAMVLLRLISHNAFFQLRRKYPEAFVVVSKGAGKSPVTLYDKAALDRFVAISEAIHEAVKQPEES